jgi:hypothetical protein
MDNWFNLIPVLLILAASLAMLVFDEWQRSIVALAILYLGVFILLVQLVPLTLSAVKLITGWAAALILGLNLPKGESTTTEGLFSNRIFKALSLVLIWVLAFLVSKSISSSFQISPEIVFSALAIFGAGLLQLGMKFRPFSIILGILTVFAGFELLYASVETSVLINGLLSAMNLLIALIGSYFAGFNQIEERS